MAKPFSTLQKLSRGKILLCYMYIIFPKKISIMAKFFKKIDNGGEDGSIIESETTHFILHFVCNNA